jgi:hypothetical protein
LRYGPGRLALPAAMVLSGIVFGAGRGGHRRPAVPRDSAGQLVAEIIAEAGFPAGVVNVVTHAPSEVVPIAGDFFDRPEVRCINFTKPRYWSTWIRFCTPIRGARRGGPPRIHHGFHAASERGGVH